MNIGLPESKRRELLNNYIFVNSPSGWKMIGSYPKHLKKADIIQTLEKLFGTEVRYGLPDDVSCDRFESLVRS